MKKIGTVYVLLLLAGFFDPWIWSLILVVLGLQIFGLFAQIRSNSPDENLNMGVMLDKGN